MLIVTIKTHPQDAIIKIDNKIQEREGNQIYLAKGKYHIMIEKYGYYSYETDIKVSRKKASFSFALKEDPSTIVPKHSTVPIIDNVNIMDTIISNDSLVVNQKIEYSFDIEMVEVKGGEYTMGKAGKDTKTKLHYISLDTFSMSKYEISQEIWIAIMDVNPSKTIALDHPVENVSWDEVQEFIKKLNAKTGLSYRLPTEAEWEYAASGGIQSESGSRNRYSGGNNIDELCWYWRNSGDTILAGRWDNERIKENHCHTHPLGELKANNFGIYDMTGNVSEWCSDWYSEEYYLSGISKNPKGPRDGKAKVYRGGSYVSQVRSCPIYYRFYAVPGFGYNYIGFRLVLD